ncbi:chorismate synthase [Micavibrio aeruginosavorus]|uniref:chorismate synthase n=1 Tax=Micavibrio aeruginosavorus TaxID=349221 RepID=UPI003F4AAE50
MSGNRFGTLFQYQSWGESHGPAIGCVVDGVPPRIELSEADIQPFLDRRKPGQSKFTTQRQEADEVKILSGVFEGQTTGTPLSLIIENNDAKSKDYTDIKDKFRPGHADFTYQKKYGIRDYRGGGRSSARETAMRVAAGAIARKILPGVTIRAAVVQVGPHKINRDNWNWDILHDNPFFTVDADIVPVWEEFLDVRRKAGSSVGAIVEVVASGVPAGLGAPVYDKLDADLAKALMSINAVKGVEIGAGFDCVTLGGEENADDIRIGADGNPIFLSNHAGGILGGISTGQDVVARVAFKPTSSILTPKQTIDVHGNETDIVTKGRHDPCVGLRGAPVVEAMVACVLADHWLRHKAQNL